MARIPLEINGKTKLLGILGRDIGYTASPAIHNTAIQVLGKNQVYVPFDIPAEGIEGFLDFFWRIGGIGFNVTTPHKEFVAGLISGHGYSSVNTVYRGQKAWMAASTDAEGLAAAVRHLGTSLRGFSRFIILGNGGVVAAILAYIAKHFETMPQVHILRRRASRDNELREPLPPQFRLQFHEFDPVIFRDLAAGGAGETLVIQATSAPHKGDNLQRFAVAMEQFNGVFVDIVYGADCALLEAARCRGVPCQNGLPMLIEQARAAQKYWWGKAAPFQDIESIFSPAET